jgi:hypothetical protein
MVGDYREREVPPRQTRRREREGMVENVHKLLLEEIGPGFVIVGPNRELLYSGGRIGQYLEMPLGTPSLELINVVSPDLKIRSTRSQRESDGPEHRRRHCKVERPP